MYLYRPRGGDSGLAGPAAVVAEVAKDIAVDAAKSAAKYVYKRLTGGAIQAHVPEQAVSHFKEPPSPVPFKSCRRLFAFFAKATTKLRPRPFTFQFVLEFEYNGNDLREARLDLLPSASDSLGSSKFIVTFTPTLLDPHNPVAHLRFSIKGMWDEIGEDKLSFMGKLDLWGNGNVTVETSSKADRVTSSLVYGPDSLPCTPLQRWRPAAPSPKIVVPQFRSVLFELAKADLTGSSSDQYNQLKAWLASLLKLPGFRERIDGGTIPIELTGYASTPGGAAQNDVLSSRRISYVEEIIRRTLGLESGSKAMFRRWPRGSSATTFTGRDRREQRVDILIRWQTSP
jgi:hypothetical protein